jgi:RNA polymerase sigma-70 factor, ECF subfamily
LTEIMGKTHFWPSLLPLTDERAFERVQGEADGQAFGQIVARWQEPVRRLCSRMLGDSHSGEDLTQETFARVFAKRREFRPEGKFSTWLWRIALNLCYDEIRRRRRRREAIVAENLEDDGLNARERASEDPAPDFLAAAREENDLTREALLELTEEQRSVLVLRYCEGLKLREVAEILDLPPTTVSSRLAVALEQISRLLEPRLERERTGPGSIGPRRLTKAL